MYRHPLPKRVPIGIAQNGRAPLLTIESDSSTNLFRKERGGDLSALQVDLFLLRELVRLYGERPFPRGNLDAGRINRLFEREILPVEGQFHPRATAALLRLDLDQIRSSFPAALEAL